MFVYLEVKLYSTDMSFMCCLLLSSDNFPILCKEEYFLNLLFLIPLNIDNNFKLNKQTIHTLKNTQMMKSEIRIK